MGVQPAACLLIDASVQSLLLALLFSPLFLSFSSHSLKALLLPRWCSHSFPDFLLPEEAVISGDGASAPPLAPPLSAGE